MNIKMDIKRTGNDLWYLDKFKECKIPWFFYLIPIINLWIIVHISRAWSSVFKSADIRYHFRSLPGHVTVASTLFYFMVIPFLSLFTLVVERGKTFNLPYPFNTFVVFVIAYLLLSLFNFLYIWKIKETILDRSYKDCLDKNPEIPLNIEELRAIFLYNASVNLARENYQFLRDPFVFYVTNNTSILAEENLNSIVLNHFSFVSFVLGFFFPKNPILWVSSATYFGFIKTMERLLDFKIIKRINPLIYLYWIINAILFVFVNGLVVSNLFSFVYGNVIFLTDIRNDLLVFDNMNHLNDPLCAASFTIIPLVYWSVVITISYFINKKTRLAIMKDFGVNKPTFGITTPYCSDFN
ncbi:hypothetical protein [Mycoplasma bradburyae]|uniref:Uncharacterized protein n=2 Tax=Mycoplasma bradburyae TaxID=2963128 RepID=A0ABT5GCS9_9MOLU|nr:hypothetical protein [Mycoplasma bradburyae]MDC4182196.1 hypothetical protein [Mycoplasma bradburyae]